MLRRPLPATCLLTLAVFGKETALLAAVAALLSALIPKLRSEDRLPVYVGLIPIGVYLLWQIVLWRHWGTTISAEAGDNVGLPFGGIVPFVIDTLSELSKQHLFWLAQLALLGSFLGACLVFLRRSPIPPT